MPQLQLPCARRWPPRLSVFRRRLLRKIAAAHAGPFTYPCCDCAHRECTFAEFSRTHVCRTFLSCTDEYAPPDSNSKLSFALKIGTRCRASPCHLHPPHRPPPRRTNPPPRRRLSTASTACSHGLRCHSRRYRVHSTAVITRRHVHSLPPSAAPSA